MNTIDDTFTIQFDFGRPDAEESNSRFAEIWDGPIRVATLLRRDDVWIVDDVDTDYVEPNHIDHEHDSVFDVVRIIHEGLDA